jgi:hypothetical protein
MAAADCTDGDTGPEEQLPMDVDAPPTDGSASIAGGVDCVNKITEMSRSFSFEQTTKEYRNPR